MRLRPQSGASSGSGAAALLVLVRALEPRAGQSQECEEPERGDDMRKLNTKWCVPGGLDPRHRCAGSHLAPLRWPGPTRAANKQTTLRNPSGEWIDEWAEGGAVIGEPSLSLGGSVSLTLVARERKRRDSNRGLEISAQRGEDVPESGCYLGSPP